MSLQTFTNFPNFYHFRQRKRVFQVTYNFLPRDAYKERFVVKPQQILAYMERVYFKMLVFLMRMKIKVMTKTRLENHYFCQIFLSVLEHFFSFHRSSSESLFNYVATYSTVMKYCTNSRLNCFYS